MNRFAAAWAVLALAAAGVAAVSLASSRGLRVEVDALRAQVDRLEARAKSEPPVPAAAVEELRQELARVDAKAADAAAKARSASASAPSASGSAPPAVSGEELKALVDEQVEEKLKKKGNGFGGDRKLPLHDLGKELALDPQTQAQVEAVVNACKKDIFALIRTPRPDGTDFAGDVVTAFLSGEPAKAQSVFARLFTEKVPGTDQTYAAGVAGIQDRARTSLQGTMGDAVYTQYRRMGVNPENIETGFDPWGEYVKEKGLK
jgi:hypothetical protein